MADILDLTMRAVAYPVCWTILVNGVDDLFVDANYFLRGLWKGAQRKITVDDLKGVEQKRIAMLVPAWHEHDVIRHMLELNLKQLDYDGANYDIFCGTYQNDPATQREVDHVARRARNVHKVIVPHDGPTNKADCLNWVYQAVQLHEQRTGRRFDILLMHDSEDIIHPLALRLYNYLIPDHDFVQTPVFPLELPWNHFIGSTYKDEFTEHHLKDMLVREHIGGLVPSAGVGSGFARDAFEQIALAHSQLAFNTSSLTEDYEIGLKFRLANKKVYFACRAIERVREVERGIFEKKKVRVRVDEYIATREFFPNEFQFAVRQRSRWVLGIALQTWEQVGWKGSLPVLWCLWRDRKALLTNFLALFGYAVAFYCLARLLIGRFTGAPWTFDNIFPPGSVLWWLVMVNTLVLAWRSVMKFVTVDRIYGPIHGLLSLPRFFVSNVINFFATAKAVKQYVVHKWTGQPLRWLKTAHAFPSVEVLRTYQRRLGELLQDREGLGEEDLAEALTLQDRTGLKLGEVITLSGLLSSRRLADALGEQLSLPVVDPDPTQIPLILLQKVPESDAQLMGVLPLRIETDGAVTVAVAAPPDPEVRTRLEQMLRERVDFVFADADALQRARHRAYRRLVLEANQDPDTTTERRQRLGARLLAAGILSQEQLDEALEQQVQTGELLGEVLVRRGWVPAEIVSEAISSNTHAEFRSIRPEEADPVGIQKLGYGLCATYSLVPLYPPTDGAPTPVACAFPLHDEVRMLVAARLGTRLQPLLAPGLDVRLALAVASQAAWPWGICGGVGGMDGVELDTIEHDPGWRGSVEELAGASRAAGRSPIDFLLAAGSVDPEMAARLRARSLGVALARPSQMESDPDHGWLPPGWALQHDIQLLDSSPRGIVVAAPRPTPRLAREVAALFPDVAVAWRVAPYSRAPEQSDVEPSLRTDRHTAAAAPGEA
jgi:adsorption protein B